MKIKFVLLAFISLVVWACNSNSNTAHSSHQNLFTQHLPTKIPAIKFDLDRIKQRDTLIALTGFNSTSYFIYKGQTMGYEYELLERLAAHLNVELKLKVVRNMDKLFDMLNRGEGDIIAHNLTITGERKLQVNFSLPINTTQQVLVQRKPKNWKTLKQHELSRKLLRTPLELSGKTIHVRENSSYYSRLQHLREETGEDFTIEAADGKSSTEFLVKQVALGEIDYTVADQNIASIGSAFYPNLDIAMPMSLQQQVAWATRINAPDLLEAINDWLEKMQSGSDYYVIYNKYFKQNRSFAKKVKSPLYAKNSGQISMYDALIRKYSMEIDWDWRLVASLIYQESKFDPQAESWVGAKGLMQMMPTTAEEFAVENLNDPNESINAGTEYLKRLERFWEKRVLNKDERLKFVLASYNVGPGHVLDAQRLANKYGQNPQKWEDNVADFLRKKSKPEYYNDPVVKSGYCRGEEPFKYVTQILKRYQHYKRFASLSNVKDLAVI